MEQKLFTELRWLYATSKESPNEIRIRIRMRDLIDSDILRHAVDTTMERYPYFRVELRKKDGQCSIVRGNGDRGSRKHSSRKRSRGNGR